MSETHEHITHSPEETIALGREFASHLKGGEIIALIGNLGTGKTHFIKGIAEREAAGDHARVNSPTFVIINEYTPSDTPYIIYHIDAYRIESLKEFEMLGFDDLCGPDSIVLIEWADKIMPLLEGFNMIQVELSYVDETSRKIIIKK